MTLEHDSICTSKVELITSDPLLHLQDEDKASVCRAHTQGPALLYFLQGKDDDGELGLLLLEVPGDATRVLLKQRVEYVFSEMARD